MTPLLRCGLPELRGPRDAELSGSIENSDRLRTNFIDVEGEMWFGDLRATERQRVQKLNTGRADRRYHHCMSEMPPAGHPSAPGPAGYPPAMPPGGPWGPVGPQTPAKPARWPMFVFSLIALVALGAAVAAWFRPIPHETPAAPAAPTYTEQQIADAKSKVCAAYNKVQNATNVNAARKAREDPDSQLLLAVNQRQVFVVGSAYIMTILTDEPATPVDLAAALNKLARLYQVYTLDGLVSESDEATRNLANETGSTIQGLCK